MDSRPFSETEYFTKVPPHDPEAEQAVLSSILMDKEAIITASEILKPEDFYNPANQAVFEAARELFAKNIPIDAITIKDKLIEKGVFEEIGGLPYIASITSASANSVNIKHYADIVEGKSILRSLISASSEISGHSYKSDEDVNQILDLAEKSIFDISQKRHTGSAVHISDITVSVFEKIEEAYANGKKITGIPTGFMDFDFKTAGLQPSDLILIAARPSMGKTALALNIVQNASIRQGIPVAVFSLEMSSNQLVNRILCSEAMVDAQKVKTGNLTEDDWPKLIEAMGPISEAPIYIDDTPGITPMELRAKCRRLKIEHGIGLVVIDYLQLMSSDSGRDSRQQEISEISRSLKAIAREMDVPVIALSQLSRACEQRSDKRSMLSDLRESGAIEQDADIVAFLYREEYYFPDTEKKNQAELIIAKQRNGPTGTVDLMWLNQYTKFTSKAKP
ncbi:MAG: replicative DNA helicase [Firmicutes bacterium]|nr:replicative DNA helicase [Bacillota bacterium]